MPCKLTQAEIQQRIRDLEEEGYQVIPPQLVTPPDWIKCDGDAHNECGKQAVWLLDTQFSGKTYLCDEHARADPNFGEDDPSYWVWKRLEQTSEQSA